MSVASRVTAKSGQKTLEDRRAREVPEGLMEALLRVRLQYSTLVHLFHLIQLDSWLWIGVAGDGDNGCYEYFIWADGHLTITDVGYGDTSVALREVINQEVAS